MFKDMIMVNRKTQLHRTKAFFFYVFENEPMFGKSLI